MTVQLLTGDSRHVLTTLASNSIHCLVTSPPYFQLRDYGTATWEGGNPDCQHQPVETVRTAWANSVKGPNGSGKNGTNYANMTKETGGKCAVCGAQRTDRQIGLEDTPEAFIAALVDVFREARRVLRDDGVAFINIGDSYARDAKNGQHKPGDSGKQNYVITDGGGRAASGVNLRSETQGSSDGKVGRHDRAARPAGGSGLKPKDLIGIPWMLAFALRADGWYLRQEIIWHKPNPMPESVTDRFTKSHEHVFMLSKSERYWFDQDAVSEDTVIKNRARGPALHPDRVSTNGNAGLAQRPVHEKRNKRDVRTIPTEPSSIPHYAMMPTELARTCILAGCPEGGTVIDPFGGAGTTGLVADRLGRHAVLIELNPKSVNDATQRVQGEAGLFSEVTHG